jgi:4-oxalmesaconate hydratase
MMIIDCHGHYTTAPKQHEQWRQQQIEAHSKGARAPGRPVITDDEIRDSIRNGQLRVQQERGTDLTIFSPRAAGMGHHLGDAGTSEAWAVACNDLIHRVCALFPDNFVGVCMLPQSPGVSPKTSVAELERCVGDHGFIGCNLNPDPSGGYWTDPPLSDPYWYPIYEKLVELDIPAMIHVSHACNPAFHTTGSHYLNGDTTAFMQFLTSDVFGPFPKLKIIIPHGGGAVPYHWGRFRGLAQALGLPPLKDHLLRNIYFDTCVYHLPGQELLAKVIPVDNILFASEMIGAVPGVDPETGHNFDDTRRYIDQLPLSAADKFKIFEGNARRVFTRLRVGAKPETAKKAMEKPQ